MESEYKSLRVQASAIAHEISMLAIACKIDITQPKMGERVLKNDTSVCGRDNPEAFAKLRRHLMAFFPLEEAAIERLGASEVRGALDAVREEIRSLRAAGQPTRD